MIAAFRQQFSKYFKAPESIKVIISGLVVESTEMNHRRFHWLEKFEVQLTCIASLGVVFFWLWPLVMPADPNEPFVFIPAGSYGNITAFCAVVLLLAAACSLATLRARLEGAVAAVLVGAMGMSLRSASVRSLLWWRENDLRAMFSGFIIELLLLGLLLLCVILIVGLVRMAVASVRPNWLWRNPIGRRPTDGRVGFREAFGTIFFSTADFAAPKDPNEQKNRKKDISAHDAFLRIGSCFLLGLVVCLALALVMIRSSDRGQIVFAVAVSSLAASLIAYHAFSVPTSIVAFAMPITAGLALYILSTFFAISGDPPAWADVPFYAQVLPVDWLTAGCAGSLVGYLTSVRIIEGRFLYRDEDQVQS